MLKKAFVFAFLTASAVVGGSAQTPAAKAEPLTSAFAWTMDGDGGYLGVQTKEVTKENFSKLGLRDVRGVVVEKVVEDSPAAAAGIQAGDVIVRFEKEEITSVRKLTRLIGEVAPDHQVALTVLRNGREQNISATLGKRPGPQFGNGSFKFGTPSPMGRAELEKLYDIPAIKGLEALKDLPDGSTRAFSFPGGEGKQFTWRAGSGRQIGVGIAPLTKQLAKHFGVESGVLINEVREGSPAEKSGLKAGDIIVEADGKALKGEFDLIRSIGEKKDGDVNLTIVRDGRRQNISVTPEVSKDGGFLFQTDDEDGVGPATPGLPARVKTYRSTLPAMPTSPALPRVLLAAPGRIL